MMPVRVRRLMLPLLVAVVAYLLVVAILWVQQDRLVFAGMGRGERPLDVTGVLVSTLEWTPGTVCRLVEGGAEQPRAVLLFFVGNGEDLTSAARRVVEFGAYGVRVLAPEYPGYGGSPGQPSKASLLVVADAAVGAARQRAQQLGVPLLVGGSSLGSFCATHVAAQGLAARCLLLAPPTTLAAAARRRYWWLPVGLLLRQRFDNLESARRLRCPVLIVHGTDDDIVPLALGQQLRDACAGPAELIAVPGAGHNDLPLAASGPLGGAIGRFLRGS